MSVSNPSGYTSYLSSHSSTPPTPLNHASGTWSVPSGFYAALRAQHNLPPAPATLCPTTSNLTSIYPAAHPPTWFTRHSYYTDGASQTISNRTHAGASFYETHQCTSNPPKLHRLGAAKPIPLLGRNSQPLQLPLPIHRSIPNAPPSPSLLTALSPSILFFKPSTLLHPCSRISTPPYFSISGPSFLPVPASATTPTSKR